MRCHRFGVIGFVIAAAALAAACGDDNTTTRTTAPTVVVVIQVVVAGTPPVVGESQQYTATAKMSDKTTKDVTAEATWKSGNNNIASVSNTGVVTGVTPGIANIAATFELVNGAAQFTIKP